MYLEISGRRSGKTTRLLAAIAKSDKPCIVVSPNRSIGRRIEHKNIAYNITSSVLLKLINDLYMTHHLTEDFNWFFEEFDYMKDILFLKKGYYCTTPIKIRDLKHRQLFSRGKVEDNLLSLIKLNDGQYHNYISGSIIKEFSNSIPERECTGEYRG